MLQHSYRPRHRIGVPRGILHYAALQILKNGPMSGSELAEEIEQYTDWRPSPGSIYPLISHLSKEGVIEPSPDEVPGLKRYILTEKGITHLKALKRHDEHVNSRHKTFRKIYWRLHLEMPEEIYAPLATFLNIIEATFMKASATPEKTRRYKEVLARAAGRLEQLGEES